VPITFVGAVIGGVLASAFGMLFLNRLSRLHHLVFHSDKFNATDDGFLISIEADDAKFDAEKTAVFLKSIGASEVEVLRG
jgi:hypothetical protein